MSLLLLIVYQRYKVRSTIYEGYIIEKFTYNGGVNQRQ